MKTNKSFEPRYVVCPTENLAQLCIKHNFCKHGTLAQCDKIFAANEDPTIRISDIISMIYLCSDVERSVVADSILEVCTWYHSLKEKDGKDNACA